MKLILRKETDLPSSNLLQQEEREIRQQICARSYPRQALANLLQNYNQELGADSYAIKNLERLREDSSVCVLSGQQLGYMGGPVYTILKALQALQVAREMQAVPLFWLATEDHDIAEIDHTYLLDPVGNLERYRLSLPRSGIAVEDLILQPRHIEEIQLFLKKVNRFPLADHISLTPGMRYAEAMARLLTALFAGTGLLLLEPYLLRKLARPFFAKEITASKEIAALMQKNHSEGSLLPLSEDTHLFVKKEKIRSKIKRAEKGFSIAGEEYSEETLLRWIEEQPELFSTNVASRPVLQSHLIPTLAYVAGPTEIRYYRELQSYHQFHQVPFPLLLPRMSVTFIPQQAEEYLKKCQLHPWEKIPSSLSQTMPYLEESKGVKHRMHTAATQLYLQELGLPTYALHYLQNLLHPQGKPQERVFNWFAFQGQTEENLIQELLKSNDVPAAGHHYCFMEK